MMPKITPGSFVSRNVAKAFYMELEHLNSIPPLQVVWFLMARKLDAKAQPARRVREMRSGTGVGRWVDAQAVPARHVALFAHTFNSTFSRSDERLVSYMLEQKGMSPEPQQIAASKRQWQAYGHSLHSTDDSASFRPVDTALVIHQLGSDRSLRLRCEWYEEHLFWSDRKFNGNRHLEDLSLSYVLSRWRKEGWLGPMDKDWGEQMLEEDSIEEGASEYFVALHIPIKARKKY